MMKYMFLIAGFAACVFHPYLWRLGNNLNSSLGF